MTNHVFAVYDSALGGYLRPFCAPSRAVAIRSFADEVRNPEGIFHSHPKDYSLHLLGYFDDQTGIFDQPEAPYRISLASDFVDQVD